METEDGEDVRLLPWGSPGDGFLGNWASRGPLGSGGNLFLKEKKKEKKKEYKVNDDNCASPPEKKRGEGRGGSMT